MLNIIVCVKQVPMVSELPWNAKTGTLRRELAEGMMDPASKRALEAALQLKQTTDVHITAVTMGPEMAKEVLHEAQAMGVDHGVLLTDRKMAGADTFLTSHVLATFIQKKFETFHLILCGSQTSDSETAQVGPQLAQALDLPSVCYAQKLNISGNVLHVERHVDDYFEQLEMDLPGLVTIDITAYPPRHIEMSGIQLAFENEDITTMHAADLDLDQKFNAVKHSPTRIINVYSPSTEKLSHVMKGSVKEIVSDLFHQYGKTIGGAMEKDLETLEHGDR